MSSSEVIQIGRELLLTAIMLSLPTVLISLITGLIISVFQTVTSIQEQTLSFAPRIIAVAILLAFTLPWMLQVVSAFTQQMMWRMAEAAR